jgi:hypothetical protein
MSSLPSQPLSVNSFSMRPTFQVVLPVAKQELQQRIKERLVTETWDWESYVFDGYFEMHIPTKELRYWSPHLSISMDDLKGETRIHGRFAPRQQVWTLVWVLYLAFVFTALFSLLFALSSMHAKDSEWRWIWVLCPASIAGIILLYLVSFIGQSWSSDQIQSLQSQWDRLIDLATRQAVDSKES